MMKKAKVISIVIAMLVMLSLHSKSEDFVIQRGINISHWLSQSRQRGSEREKDMQAIDFETIAKAGFDHVRIPFDEEQMWDEDGNRHEDAFKLLHNAIAWARQNKLRVIMDLHILRSHHFNAESKRLWTDTLAQQQFWGFWKELSAEFKQYPNHLLAYELMNEAVADDPEDWNKLIARGIAVIRENEPERKIVVGSNKWQQVNTFYQLKIPENDKNLILSFHYYEPFIITHHQASWIGTLKSYKGEVHYPGFPVDTVQYVGLSPKLLQAVKHANRNYTRAVLEQDILLAKKIADKYQLPLYCGEFGCYPTTPVEVRQRLYSDLITVFDKYDIAWAHWNYKKDFPLFDEVTLKPIEAFTSILIK